MNLVDPEGGQEQEPQSSTEGASPHAALSSGRMAFALGALRSLTESNLNRAIKGPLLSMVPGLSSWEPFRLGNYDRSDKAERSWNPFQQALQEGHVSDEFAGKGLDLFREGKYEAATQQFQNSGFWFGRAIDSSLTFGQFAATPGKGAEPGLAGLSGLPRVLGQGRKLTLIDHARRFFIQDTKSYPAVGSSWGGRGAQWLWTKLHGPSLLGDLQQGHILIQQRWFKLSSTFAQFPANPAATAGLKRLGNAGWNLLPLPAKINRLLGQTNPLSRLATAGVAGMVYGGLGAELYWAYSAVKNAYEDICKAYFRREEADRTPSHK